MPFVTRPYDTRLSALVFHEGSEGQAPGFSRDSLNITPPAGGAPVLLGTVVYRTKTIDRAAPFAVLTAASQIVDTNEFAVVLGDNYSWQRSFVPNAIVTGEYNAVGFVRRVQLKEFLIKQIHSNLTAAQFALLKGALSKQGVLVEITV